MELVCIACEVVHFLTSTTVRSRYRFFEHSVELKMRNEKSMPVTYLQSVCRVPSCRRCPTSSSGVRI